MISSFRKADCVIQSVDIGGLRADERITDVSATGQGFHSRLNSGQDGLFYMARETGGELFKDATDLSKQLPEVLDRSAITYLLTFQTDELPTTGRFRKLRVKLAGARAKDDLRLAYRQGYFEPRPYPTLAPLEKDLLASDAIASATPLDDVEISLLAAPFRSSPRHAYVAVILELAGTSLLAGHPKESPKLPVEIYAYASNADNEVQGFFSQQINLDVSKGRQKLEGSGLKYYGHLDLKPGSYQLRVLVRNAVTGRTGVTTTALNVPPYETTAPVVLPPFFPEEKPRFFMVRERQPEGQLDSTVYPFTINGEPYVPSALPQVGHSGAAQFYLVGYNLGQGQLALAGELVDAQGGAVSGGEVKLVERTATGIAGYDKLLATFQPPKLPTGLYTLKVALTNPSTGETRSSSIPIEILN
nr:hypothetical protein [Thermoanaerobaculia bacterium]